MQITYKNKFGFWILLLLVWTLSLSSQTPNSNLTPGGANGMVFRFTKQVWLNPTVILAKQKFEQATNVKLLILPRTNASDTSNNTKIEKAFDKLLAFLVFKENIQGSIKFYFNPKNPSKPFSFDWSEDLQCKFNKFHNLYKDTIEGILNNGLVNHPSLNNFAALPFDSIIGKASRYCRNILLLHPAPCGENQNSEFDLAQINSTPAKLEFAKVPNTSLTYNGGYDILTYNELEAYYNTVTDLADGSTYKVGWKAIKDNDILKLKLTKKQPSFDVSKLVFKNAKGTVSYNVSVNPDSTLSLSMGGQSPGSMAEVVAYYTPTTTPVQTYPIGAFNVKFYEPKIYNLVLVSLDANPLSLEDQAKLKDSLNKIYGPVFIQWNLSQVRYNLPTTISKSIHDASSGLLSNYMPDMQPIVSSFKNSSSYNGDADNTVYIILGASIDNTEIKGYMPRARNTGFVFVQPEVSSFFIRTLAHEVGHGAFNLKHIFSSDELGEGNKTQTNNVMDYASGRQLYKHQWDLIHDPSFVGWFEGDDEEAMYETDGHYSTVYLVCLMLGMDKFLARDLAIATENPDTDVHSEFDFEIDQTWAYPNSQLEIHSLTGGFHTVEEMMTAFKLIYIDKSETKKIGELLHRYGDTYAHTRLDNFMPEKLKDYEFSDTLKLRLYIQQWKNQNSPQILDRIAPWVNYLNYYLNIHGYKFLTDVNLQKQHLEGKNLVQYLHSLYPNQPVDKFKLYGNGGYTSDHAFVDKALPDFIYVRPKWYLSYVQNLSTLLQYKYNELNGELDLSLFNIMVQFATDNQCSLKGIIDYEIAKKKGERFFYIPVFYSNPERLAASYDAIKNSNYLKIAKDALEATKKYLNQKNVKFTVTEMKGSIKYNIPEGFFTTRAFTIDF